MKMRLALAVGGVLAVVTPSFGWNAAGHHVIALIAWNEMTVATREKVSALLRQHPHYSTLLMREGVPPEQRDREAFVLAASWPDVVRTGPYVAKYNHPVWHYVDFPFVQGEVNPQEDPVTFWTMGTDPQNAAQAHAKSLAELADEHVDGADRAVAIGWIEHLDGDIHQPLHGISWLTPALPTGDRGGNQLMVKGPQGMVNLHAFWDDQLGRDQPTPALADVAAKLEAAHPRAEFAEKLKDVNFVNWAKDSAALAREVVYTDGKIAYANRDLVKVQPQTEVPELPGEYVKQARTTSEKEMALAGYRLADELNRVFDPPATQPAAEAGR